MRIAVYYMKYSRNSDDKPEPVPITYQKDKLTKVLICLMGVMLLKVVTTSLALKFLGLGNSTQSNHPSRFD